MFVIRPICKADLGSVFNLLNDNFVGMNISHDIEILKRKIDHSEACFHKRVETPQGEEYFFVLEDLDSKKLGGTAVISARLPKLESYLYQIETIHTPLLPALSEYSPKACRLLKPIRASSAISEIGSLYLHPHFRRNGLGKLLSLSRFLFMAAFLPRIHSHIAAVMRAYINQEGDFPFWKGIASHFCHFHFSDLMDYVEKHPEIISALLPAYPIYIDLLPKEIQDSIGKVHDQTLPALKMLQEEGFSFQNEIDVFDGGPMLKAVTKEIRTIKQSALLRVKATSTSIPKLRSFLLANERLSFRCCFGNVQIERENTVIISPESAEALQVKKDDFIRIVKISH